MKNEEEGQERREDCKEVCVLSITFTRSFIQLVVVIVHGECDVNGGDTVVMEEISRWCWWWRWWLLEKDSLIFFHS